MYADINDAIFLTHLKRKLDIVSRCSVSPYDTWLKRDIQSIMLIYPPLSLVT